MGKTLDQLNLGDDPLPGGDALLLSRKQAEELLADVQDMLDGGQYDFAWGYLISLKVTLEQTERVTPAQIQAVENIKEGAAKHEEQLQGWERHERRTGRRYEGWSPNRS